MDDGENARQGKWLTHETATRISSAPRFGNRLYRIELDGGLEPRTYGTLLPRDE